MKKLALLLTVFWAAQLFAGTICPAVTPDPGILDPSGCNALITIAANGSTSVVVTDTHPYEFSEDQLVGVINNSSSLLTSIALSGSNIFGFDGDGICGDSYIASSYCTNADATRYGPNGVTFSITNNNTGMVNFSPGIAGGGGTGFFSLEEAPSVGGITVGAVPEPATLSTLAVGLLGLAGWARRRFRA